MDSWKWFGRAGHFCAADRCRFHLHTHVGDGKYCVSTVGAYYPGAANTPEQIGFNRLYETMVFRLDKKGAVKSWRELASKGYNDEEEADRGHILFCETWHAKGTKK